MRLHRNTYCSLTTFITTLPIHPRWASSHIYDVYDLGSCACHSTESFLKRSIHDLGHSSIIHPRSSVGSYTIFTTSTISELMRRSSIILWFRMHLHCWWYVVHCIRSQKKQRSCPYIILPLMLQSTQRIQNYPYCINHTIFLFVEV